jgi:hypothetical protein
MPVPQSDPILTALYSFARQVRHDTELATRIRAHPEDQLKRSVPELLASVGQSLGLNVSVLSESPIDDVGRPDLAIAVDGLLTGYIELKAPGEGTTERELSTANRVQLRRFRSIPNLIYTDARDWTFYAEGVRQPAHDIRLGPIDETGDAEITEADAAKLREMLRVFLGWQPIVPSNPRALAEVIAPLTRMLRDDVAKGVAKPRSALSGIYEDWKRTLFPEAEPEEFADSYAQTVTYGLLLAKLDGATVRDTHTAAQAIAHHSSLLSRTLEILTQPGTPEELGVGLELLERTIEAVNPIVLKPKSGDDPWLYFYEDFLAVYDPKLRNERGVYYTPVQVVKAQVALVDELLRTKLGIPDGVAGQEVTVLDPACGTGTYLLQILQQGIDNVAKRLGPGAVSGVATQMASNLYGFELLVGPYAVAHLRLSQAIRNEGGHVPQDGALIYLADTLESPNQTLTLPHSQYERPLAEEHRKAREVKSKSRILVCIGNPPYERVLDEPGSKRSQQLGGWVREGDPEPNRTRPIIEDFTRVTRKLGLGAHLKTIHNLYVYFWRWAMWKVFDTQNTAGAIAFISASSYMRGPGFVGMREEMRRSFDELWLIDLHGDSRGTRTSENVFDIRTPVAIAVGYRAGAPDRDTPARVSYTRIDGTREEKYSTLSTINSFVDLQWRETKSGWHDTFLPYERGDYFDWPELPQLMPLEFSGVDIHRSWPVGETREVLNHRWRRLVSAASLIEKQKLLRETRDRKASGRYPSIDQVGERLPPLESLGPDDLLAANLSRYAFRTLDRQWLISDGRIIDYPRPHLWQLIGPSQIFLTTILAEPISSGPGATLTTHVPDLHHFRGSLGGRVFPLYRNPEDHEPNANQRLLLQLKEVRSFSTMTHDLFAYIVGVIGHPSYTERYHEELDIPGPRVPLTKEPALFQHAVELGKQVIAWQTYAERFPEAIGTTKGRVPSGNARLEVGIPDNPLKYPQNLNDVSYTEQTRELRIGEGLVCNVHPRVWSYEVSGLRVVRSWLGYRMKERSGRRSSPLDDIRPERWTLDMTRELMELLWVLEGVIALEPAQAQLLDEIVAGPLFLASELPVPTDAERQPPTVIPHQQTRLGGDFQQ